MNSLDHKLDRLLKAAAKAPRPAADEAPFGMATRVLAEWRAPAQPDAGDFLLVWFRRAALCACALTLAGLVWNYGASASPGGAEQVADAAMSAGVEP